MECPTCHKPLNPNSLHGQAVDQCPTCNGLWLDDAELGPIIRQTKPPRTATEAASCCGGVACPRCNDVLAPFNYAHDSGVFVNKCPSCGGMWLEAGRLELLARYRAGSPAIQRLENAWAEEIRAANRWQFARGLLRSRFLSSIVAISYLLVVAVATASLYAVVISAICLVLPVACIWFPDAMGRRRGISLGLLRPMITRTSPGDAIAVGGWLVLITVIVITLIVRSQ